MTALLRILVVAALLAQPFIDLVLAVPLPGWYLDAPVADWMGAALVALLPWLARQPDRPPLPAPLAWAAFLGFGLLTIALVDPAIAQQGRVDALHAWLRKPLFVYVAWAVALPWALGVLDGRTLRRVLLAAILLTAAVSIATSLVRIGAGGSLWWSRLEGLTPNHKTLAVWLAPWVPLLVHQRARWAGGLLTVALLLSGSKAALLVGLFGLGWAVHVRGAPLVRRWHATALAGVGALSLALAAPQILDSRAMQDAARSRGSLDLRAWRMFQHAPVLGLGPGSATTVEMTEFPHYRINHVEAHGVVQKVGSEGGLAGLLTWGAFTALLGLGLIRRWDGETTGEGWAWLGVAAALHVGLLGSTEAFTMTHWIPLGVTWAAMHRGPGS